MIALRKIGISAALIGCWTSASHAEPTTVFPFGTFKCVRNPAEESIQLEGRVVLPEASSFELRVQAASNGASAILGPVPNEQFPQEEVRLTRFSVVTRRATERTAGKLSLFIFGQGTSADGRSVLVSDLWVGDSDNALDTFNPRIEYGNAVTSVTCVLVRQERPAL